MVQTGDLMLQKLVVLTGPTGVGKTKYSIKLAQMFNGEIINCDASQIYKYLDIGTAKITSEETKGIKHHLIDIKNPNEEFSIKEYQNLAREKIEEIASRSKVPFLVGGSGLYIKATVTDYQLSGPARSVEFEEQFSHLSNESLHQLLAEKDLKSAQLIHPNNRRRVLRALQMIDAKLSIKKNNDIYLYDTLIITFNSKRDILYSRINKRTEEMMTDGWLLEARKVNEMGYDLKQISAIGYSEIKDYLDGFIAYNQLLETIQQKTRRYAKRQLTWIRNQLDSKIIEIDYQNPTKALEEAKMLIDNFLKNVNK